MQSRRGFLKRLAVAPVVAAAAPAIASALVTAEQLRFPAAPPPPAPPVEYMAATASTSAAFFSVVPSRFIDGKFYGIKNGPFVPRPY